MKRSQAPEGAKGVLLAVAIVLGVCIVAGIIGWLLTSALALLVPLPAWSVLVFSGIALVPLLFILVRLFPWIVSWYYLLPAVIFLLTFTVYPIILTVYYAFTNYSAQNSGEADSSTQLSVKKLANVQLMVLEGDVVSELRCENKNCTGQRIALIDPDKPEIKPFQTNIEEIQGGAIFLTSKIPDYLNPKIVSRVNPVKYVGFNNFKDIFAQASSQLWPIFIWTVAFAAITTILNMLVGIGLGILLNNKRLKFRNLYRTLLFLPWAVPAVISVQIWRDALLSTNTGAINRVLGLFGALPIPWRDDELWAKVTILLVNLWLGFPYMMTAAIGALATIPDELYEAAEVDGASKWQQIRKITIPMLLNSFTPIMLSVFAFNFNNFNIIYLLTGGGPAVANRLSTGQSTDILISWGFKTAFSSSGSNAYGPASAIAVIIAILTIIISIINFWLAGVFKEGKK